MAVRIRGSLPFAPDEASVRHYIPKIHKAVGHNRQLFPLTLPKQLKADIARDSKLAGELDALARHLCRSQFRNASRDHRLAQTLLRGFIAWLDKSNYKYTSRTANSLADSPPERYIKKNWKEEYLSGNGGGQKVYNLFASVGAPIGDCSTTATAFALLMAMNGFPCNELTLCVIMSDGDMIAFRGNGRVQAEMAGSARADSLTSVVTVGGHGPAPTLVRVPASSADTPFFNHWVVGWGNRFYDANYRCSYADPANVFDEGEGFNLGARMKGFEGHFNSFTKVAARGNVFLQFESEQLLRSFCPSLAGDDAVSVFVMADDPPQQDPVTIGEGTGQVRVSHEVARLFGWCVPDDIASVKQRLMNAVEAYDRTVTGTFFRIATDDSKDFCRRSRKWCGTAERAPNNRIYSGVNWGRVDTWSDADARKSIYEALARDTAQTVGRTLYVQLCDAFGFPTALRQPR